MYTYQVYKDRRGQWRWRLRADNGKIIATSGGDGYKNLQDCMDMVGVLRSNPNTEIVVLK